MYICVKCLQLLEAMQLWGSVAILLGIAGQDGHALSQLRALHLLQACQLSVC